MLAILTLVILLCHLVSATQEELMSKLTGKTYLELNDRLIWIHPKRTYQIGTRQSEIFCWKSKPHDIKNSGLGLIGPVWNTFWYEFKDGPIYMNYYDFSYSNLGDLMNLKTKVSKLPWKKPIKDCFRITFDVPSVTTTVDAFVDGVLFNPRRNRRNHVKPTNYYTYSIYFDKKFYGSFKVIAESSY